MKTKNQKKRKRKPTAKQLAALAKGRRILAKKRQKQKSK